MTARPIAITMGEPAGIGSELTLKAWMARHKDGAGFIALADAELLAREADRLGLDISFGVTEDPSAALDIFPRALPVYHTPLSKHPDPGQPIAETASSVISVIETAVQWAIDGQVDSIVTNPISKHVLYDAGFNHPGHTEFLAELSGADNPPVMMLACSGLRVVPVTTHVGLRQGLDILTSELIIEQAALTHGVLKRDFAIPHPRLAIAGLNPHAGESGAMGSEENDIIIPAIKTLRSQDIDATGPEPPDTLFSKAKRQTYDAAICMYHDQALIPIKTLDFTGGVNITLGLPIVRTSPDHGTAFNIAGTGQADPTSMLTALDMAAELAANRRTTR